MNKLITKVTLFLLLSSFTCIKAQYILTINDVEFDTTNGTITDYTNNIERNIIIPQSFNIDGSDVVVTNIGDWAFNSSSITSVTIPSTITSIGDYAFSSNFLSSVEIPNSVTSIGGSAFYSNFLTSVIIPNSVASIGGGAFSTNSLTSVTISNNITSIEGGVFSSNALTSVSIPDGVTSIGNHAFSSNALTSLTIPTSVTSIGMNAFSSNALTSLTIPNSVTNIGDNAFSSNSLISVTIPNSITVLGNGIFYGNSLASVTIPNSITSIGDYAFMSNSLTSLTIPNSVKFIGRNAFSLNSLSSVDISNSVTSIGADGFSFNSLTSVTIPNSVTSIGAGAFYSNSLSSIVIPNSVRFIGISAFSNNSLTSFNLPIHTEYNSYGWVDNTGMDYNGGDVIDNFSRCYTIPCPYTLTINDLEFDATTGTIIDYLNTTDKTIIIPSAFNVDGNIVTVKSIGEWAFSSKSLITVTIPNSVNLIGRNAFASNYLTTIGIPNSVTGIEDRAFSSNSLSSVEIPNRVMFIGQEAFSSNKLSSFILPIHTEHSSFGWVDNAGVIYNGGDVIDNLNTCYIIPRPYTLTINDVTFDISTGTITNYLNATDKAIIIPSAFNVDGSIVAAKRIGEGAFSANSLISVIIPNSVLSIESGAFSSNYLSSVDIPNSVSNIGDYAFSMNALTSIDVPNSVISIGKHAFYKNSITLVNIPNSVTTIGAGAFNNNAITMLNDLASNGIIYARKSDGSEDVTTIVSYGGVANVIDFIPNSAIVIGDDAFSSNSLTSVIIPNNVTAIGISAFSSNSLTSVLIPNDVTTIEQWTFSSNSLTSVSLPSTVTTIGRGAFLSNSLTSVDIPNSVISIGEDAFYINLFSSFSLPIHFEYESLGWLSGDGSVYSGGDEVNDLRSSYNIPGGYTIKYICNGGTVSQTNPNIYNTDDGVDLLSIPTKAGYDFVGWFSDNNVKFEDVPVGTEGNLTLYAKWDNASGMATVGKVSIRSYPNPCNGVLNLYGEISGSKIKLTDLSGRIVFCQEAKQQKEQINLLALRAGTYLLIVEKNGQVVYENIVLKQ